MRTECSGVVQLGVDGAELAGPDDGAQAGLGRDGPAGLSLDGATMTGARLETRKAIDGGLLTTYDLSGTPVTVKVVAPKPDQPVAGNVSAWVATSAPNLVRLFNTEKQSPKTAEVDLGAAAPIDIGKTGFLVVLTREAP